jgi:LPS sulfotransferase NodH
LVAGGMMNKTLQELIQFRQELYEEAWQIHLKLQTIEKTNLSYQELIAEKNRVESNIGHLTTIIMKMKGNK